MVSHFAVMLLFVLISWERLTAILVALFHSGSGLGSLGDLLAAADAALYTAKRGGLTFLPKRVSGGGARAR